MVGRGADPKPIDFPAARCRTLWTVELPAAVEEPAREEEVREEEEEGEVEASCRPLWMSWESSYRIVYSLAILTQLVVMEYYSCSGTRCIDVLGAIWYWQGCSGKYVRIDKGTVVLRAH